MSQGAIIAGVVVMLCCSSSAVAFMMMKSSSKVQQGGTGTMIPPPPSAGGSGGNSGSITFYGGCNYDGEVLQNIDLNNISDDVIQNAKGQIKTAHFNELPQAEHDNVIHKSMKYQNMSVTGTYDKMGVMSSQTTQFNKSGSGSISFCDPPTSYGATKLNLEWKLLKN